MKEIKFRAWHKLYKKMYEVHDLILNSQPNEIEPLVWANCWGRDLIEDKDIILHVEKLELMQFTGLKDKKGKDIYEGDIVKTLFAYTNKGITEEISVIVFIEGEFVCRKDYKHRLQNERQTLTDSPIRCFSIKYREIIGNIYENMGLLK